MGKLSDKVFLDFQALTYLAENGCPKLRHSDLRCADCCVFRMCCYLLPPNHTGLGDISRIQKAARAKSKQIIGNVC